MTSDGRYELIEFPGGWRVLERTSNGEKFHNRTYKTEVDAQARIEQLNRTRMMATATALVRKRSKNRCECLGECDRGHHARCGNRADEHDRIPGGGDVVLSVVALNHHDDDLREENLRIYCQLCRLYHDAETAGAEPLFTIGGVDEH